MKKAILFVCAALIIATAASQSQATVPDLIPVQGVLSTSMGDPVEGPVDITFALYESESGGTSFWSEVHTSMVLDEGFFTVYLGSTTTLNFTTMLSYSEIWLGITVDSDPEMTRVRFAAVPFAQEALVCQQVGTLTETAINDNFASTAHNHNGDYLAATYLPSWTNLTDIPLGFADNTDNGLVTEGELTALLDDNYMPLSYVPDWNELQNIPAGFADAIDDNSPVGSIVAYGGSTAPAGWLLCDGTEVSRTTYADLFAVIGTTFGVGDGSTTFNLPDLSQRFPLGLAAAGTGGALGESGGAVDHLHSTTLAVGDLPAHDHTFTAGTNTTGAHSHDVSIGTDTTGNHGHTAVDTAGSYQIQWCGSQCLPYFCGASTGCAQFRLGMAPQSQYQDGNHSHTASGTTEGVDDHGHSVSGTTDTTGAGNAASTTTANPPYLAVNYLIKN